MKQDDIITQLFYRREYGNKKLDLLITQGRKKMANSKQSDKDQLSFLTTLGGNLIGSLIDGLEMVDPETRKKIMELCGKDD